MIANYDKETGLSFFNIFKNIPKVSNEVNDLFDSVTKDTKLTTILNKFYDKNTFKDSIFNDWVDGLDNTAKTSMTAGGALKAYTKHVEETANATSKLSKVTSVAKGAIGTVFSSAVNIGAGIFIAKGIEYAISKWDEYNHAQEYAIEASGKAYSRLQENQNKIKNVDNVLKNIKENTVIDSSGNEITRLEQLSQGVNSLGQNISLTKEEFDEYNSILDSMSSAGLTATSSMENLEAQVRKIRKSSNIDSLKGLNDWVDGFNAQNNQLYTDHTKEIGYQQKLGALNKMIADNGEKVPKIDTQTSWDTLSDNLAATNELRDAWNSYEGTNAKEHIDKAKKINKDTDLKKTETKALKQIAKDYDIDILDKKGNFSYKKYSSDEVQNQLKDARQQMETQVEAMVQQSSGFLQAMFENSSGFENVSESVSTAIGNIFSNIDYNTISEHMMDSNGMLSQQMMRDWVKNLSKNVQEKSVQDKISQLFNMDSKSDTKSFVEYKKQALGLVKDISSAVPQLSEGLLKDTTGLGDILDEASSSYNRVAKTVGHKFARTLSLDDINLAADIISKQDVKNAEDLKTALLLSKEAAKDISVNPIFDSIKVADESKNAGDDYVSALKYVEEAKEMYDKGLIGTDDFKMRAKYLSPTGSEDPANFIENYSKATKYLTEDSSGVQNFLNDLERKGYATFETLSDGTKKWSYDISDLEGAAENMGMGFEFFMDMFGRLEDYGFSNNFFSSQEEGIEKISEKTSELVQAKKELAEMETTGQYTTTDDNGNQVKTEANQTAIDAKKAEIAGLENDLNELQNNLETVTQSNIDRIYEQITETKEQYRSLKEERDKILAENRYGENTDEVVAALDEQLKGLAQEGYFEIDANLNIVESAEEIQEKLKALQGTGEISESINLDFNLKDMDTDEIRSKVRELEDERATIDVETSPEAAQDLDNLIAKCSEEYFVKLNVETDGGMDSAVSIIDKIQNRINELVSQNPIVSVTTAITGDEQLELLAGEIALLPKDVQIAIGVTAENVGNVQGIINQLTQSPESINVPVNYQKGSEPESVDDAQGKANYTLGDAPTSVPDAWGTANFRLGAYPKVLPSATQTVLQSFLPPRASGTMLSPAHADGTAYNTLNTLPAHASGDVTIQKSEKALVNELPKPESIVRNGVWSIIPGGAHIQQLKKGDIIFNGEQTEQLLKHGKISDHGKAYADGTVSSIRSLVSNPLSAYAGGSGGGSFQGGAATGEDKKKPSTSKDKSKSKKKSSNSSSSTDDAKEFEETLDWIEIKIDRLERKIKNLERVAGSAFETYTDRSKALAEQMGEVSNQITVQQQAYERYLQQANSVSLSDDYKSQVQNGTIDISTITDEDLKKNIDDYKQW